ncbi:hypothetical protein QJS10_CPA16g01199 [Acorus calamus]|uniref:holo-[acyl-carrier-protein] synthase n=1 Tax=Acorus calamus TaxID=4465 RepID=A0AAV9D2J8_ACOCL|nr:hypothetical protein QJS10_CPA16g01199 [Acorus calamus]
MASGRLSVGPPEDLFSSVVSLLPFHERPFITRFLKFEDRKRALVSRLLQYALVREVLGIPFDEIIIKRTVEGKPYLENGKGSLDFPNFNFNVSHHGDYVGIASEPICLVGLDIVSHSAPKQESAIDFVSNFSSYFTSLEWNNIINAGTSDEILVEFYKYWCLKEAYIKAIGVGLGYRLDRLEFRHIGWANISVCIDGEESMEWRFWLLELEKKHWAGIARGHPKRAADSYRRTLSRDDFNDEEYCSGLFLPNTDFMLRTIEQLIPVPTSRQNTTLPVERLE